MATTKPAIRWMEDCEEQDFPAAASYLALTMRPSRAHAVLRKLRRATVTSFKAKDIFRASGLSLLGVSNSHVEKDRARIRRGTPLSPLLLVRDEALGRVIVADGYHRLCAVYSFDEDALVPCRIVSA
jgi:hypothetical protein